MYDYFFIVIVYMVKFLKCFLKLLRKFYDFFFKMIMDVIFWFLCLLKINFVIIIYKCMCMDLIFLVDIDFEKNYFNRLIKCLVDYLWFENRILNV